MKYNLLFFVVYFICCFAFFPVLPKREILAFPCGVKVELSFSALFSNVLVVFATVKDTGPKTQDCSVSLKSTPVSQGFLLKFIFLPYL